MPLRMRTTDGVSTGSTDFVSTFVQAYRPASLPASEWEVWRPEVAAVVAAAGPANRAVANIWLGVLCEAIAVAAPTPGTPLGEVLSEHLIGLVTRGRLQRGRSSRFAGEARVHLTRLQGVARGIAPRTNSRASGERLPFGPGLRSLHVLAEGEDVFLADTATVLLAALRDMDTLPGPCPLPRYTWTQFVAQAREHGHLQGSSWRLLRSERAWEELLAHRPAIEVLGSLNYTPTHLDRLSRMTRKDVPDPDSTLRGYATITSTCTWTVQDYIVTSPHTLRTPAARGARTRSTPTTSGKVSKAAARRLAAQFATALTSEPEPLPDALEAILSTWSPSALTRSEWDRARDLTCEVMRRCHIRGVESFKKHLRLVAGLVAWALQTGYPERLEDILTGEAIDAYLRGHLSGRPNSTLATMRADLRRIATHVNRENGGPVPAMPIAHSDVKPPYTERDIYWILERIALVRHPPARRATQTAVALGLGAGLTSGDLLGLTRAHIDDLAEDGILVHVPGQRPRSVWLRHNYEDLLRSGLECLTRNEHVLGRRQHKDTVRDLYDAIQPLGDGPRVLQGRLRNTWIATLMCEPIPIQTLLHAAGLEGARTLTDIAPYIHSTVNPTIVRGIA